MFCASSLAIAALTEHMTSKYIHIYIYILYIYVTTGNGTSTKIVLKLNHVLGFEFSIQSYGYSATTVAKLSLFSTCARSTVSF